jgi:microcystin-dependent protein
VTLDLQYDVINDAPASASPVEANFNRIEQYTNQELISRDGSVAMTGQLRLVGNPISALDAVTKQYVDTFLPIGIIMMFGGVAAPPGGRWAVCNGTELEVALWPDLYDVIGRNWTPETVPAGRFNLPNFADRTAMGVGALTALGATGGRRDSPVVAHIHSIDHDHASFISAGQSATHTHTFSDTTSTTSSAGTHDHTVKGVISGGAGGGSVAGIVNDVSFGGSLSANTATDGAHTHTVAVSGTTSTPNSGHTHAIDVPNYAGVSGPASFAITEPERLNSNLPPYLGVPHIMRVA